MVCQIHLEMDPNSLALEAASKDINIDSVTERERQASCAEEICFAITC